MIYNNGIMKTCINKVLYIIYIEKDNLYFSFEKCIIQLLLLLLL